MGEYWLLLKYTDGLDSTHKWNIDKYGKYWERHDIVETPFFIKDEERGPEGGSSFHIFWKKRREFRFFP